MQDYSGCIIGAQGLTTDKLEVLYQRSLGINPTFSHFSQGLTWCWHLGSCWHDEDTGSPMSVMTRECRSQERREWHWLRPRALSTQCVREPRSEHTQSWVTRGGLQAKYSEGKLKLRRMMQFIDLFEWVKRPGIAWRGKSHEINAFCGELNIVMTHFSFRARIVRSQFMTSAITYSNSSTCWLQYYQNI